MAIKSRTDNVQCAVACRVKTGLTLSRPVTVCFEVKRACEAKQFNTGFSLVLLSNVLWGSVCRVATELEKESASNKNGGWP